MSDTQPGTWDPMLWIDLETTGLDPEYDDILEIAAIITDKNLTEIARFHEVWHTDVPKESLDSVVLDMHTANGLLEECYASENQAHDRWGTGFQRWLSNAWPTSDKIILAGSGVHFDKAFLIEWGLGDEFELHYRVFDTSTLKRFFIGTGETFNDESNHRAMADVEAALKLTNDMKMRVIVGY